MAMVIGELVLTSWLFFFLSSFLCSFSSEPHICFASNGFCTFSPLLSVYLMVSLDFQVGESGILEFLFSLLHYTKGGGRYTVKQWDGAL